MGAEQIIIVAIGALAGGFVAGFAGFGTGITALGIWLYALQPAAAASLVIICSVITQVQTIPVIWRHIDRKRVLPFIVPGLLGVPLGVLLLSSLDVRVLKIGVGVVVLAFSLRMLVRSSRKNRWGGRGADGVVGFGGGILGGLAGLSGPLPTMWSTFRGWTKEESRSVIQAFNLTILSTALVSHAIGGFLTAEVGWAVLAALPGTAAGGYIGAKAYAKLSDQRFRQIILGLLCVSGLSLILTNL
ncbi:MAG: sulfite exporter TauE/SafE family protein [Burkholderiales bacterium]